MSMSYTRTLTFKTEHLGTDATLLLVFDQASDGLYNDKFPVVWKVVKFASTGPYHITTTFSSQLAWLQPQINHSLDSIVDGWTCTPIRVRSHSHKISGLLDANHNTEQYNQKTTLHIRNFDTYFFHLFELKVSKDSKV
ncbi:hypothetical protein EV363DRAFT_1419241 [Boletus edulis]|nr:hypothetical protein EV363DRAFT_1419241 [Boletus edulis]